MKNYYSYLNISELSSTDEIKIAYRRLAQKFHPDRYTGDDAEEKMKFLNEIKSVLLNQLKKNEYDDQLKSFRSFQEKREREAKQGLNIKTQGKGKFGNLKKKEDRDR